jgi:dephospho-CoA kinase
MSIIKYNPEKPIVVGLAGKALTGKTSAAEAIVPKARIINSENGMVWDHIYFALPLYELASVRKMVSGSRAMTRQMYGIHDTLYDLFGGSPIANVPVYEEMVQLVRNVYDLPIEPEGIKPRSFLQKAGDLCRAQYIDCFADWAINKARSIHFEYVRSLQEDVEPLPMSVIISDVRMLNEAEAIKNHENGILVCYTASEEVRRDRMMQRDGMLMTDEQLNHISELQMDEVCSMADLVMDTDDKSIETQAALTSEFVRSSVGVYA